MNRQVIVVAAAIVAVLAFGLGSYFYSDQQTKELGRLLADGNSPLNRPGAPTLGPQEAKVEVVEFFDPACESCRAFYPHVKGLLNANAQRVRLTLRYAAFHNGSEYVVRVLEAARLQSPEVYWNVFEAVLVAQPTWADHARPQAQLVWNYLGQTGLDIEKARRDMNDPRITERLKQDAADLRALKVARTPTFFVNGKPLQTFGPDGLRTQVRDEIASAYGQ